MRAEIDFFWYFGICCVGISAADYGCNAEGIIHQFDRAGNICLQSSESGDYTAWSSKEGIEAKVRSKILNEGFEKRSRMHIWDNGNYAKYYRRFPGTGPHRSTIGEKLSSEMMLRFSTIK